MIRQNVTPPAVSTARYLMPQPGRAQDPRQTPCSTARTYLELQSLERLLTTLQPNVRWYVNLALQWRKMGLVSMLPRIQRIVDKLAMCVGLITLGIMLHRLSAQRDSV